MEIRARFLKPANAHILLVSLLLGGVGVLLLGLQQTLKVAEDSIRSGMKVAVFMQATISDAEAEKWSRSLPSIDPEIESVRFISRGEALQNSQANPALAKSLQLLRDNPLPASVVIRYKESAWLERPEPAVTLKGLPQVQEIRWDAEERSYYRSVHQWRLGVLRIGTFSCAAGILSLCVAVFRLFVVLLLISRLPALCYADAYDTLLKRYEKQIQQQERQMKTLRVRLEEKERDVARWRAKADEAKAAWSEVSASLEDARTKVKSIHEKGRQVRVQADAAQWKTTENILLSQSALMEARVLARDLYGKQLIEAPQKAALAVTMEEAAPEFIFERVAQLTASSRVFAEEAQKEETSLRTDELRWQNEEQARSQEADRLHEKQESQWLKWQAAQQRKVAMEDEISQIDQSAKALEVMVQELRDHRDQARALRENRSVNDQALASLKGTLPWPARGKVIQNFGRQYMDGLNQLVISNGIKIEAGVGHTVRAIREGKVLFANAFRQYGQLIIVQHQNGLTSVYAGLGQTQVKEGQVLATLDQIGLTGDSGSFYFELRRDEQPMNPLVYLSPSTSSELSLRRKFR